MDSSTGLNVTLGLSFLAGLASFLSPCVFSLVPAYISYLSGRSIAATQNEGLGERIETLAHGLAFVLGFSAVFVLLGVAASSLGQLLSDVQFIIAKLGGIIVILFGLHMTGLVRIKYLEYDLRPESRPGQQRSYLTSALMGVFFSAGWSPCVGPVLGTILTFAMNGGSVVLGIQWLSAYSAGLAVPFLIAAVSVGWVTQLLRRYRRALRLIEIAMGAILIIVGAMLFFGLFSLMASLGKFVNFGL